MKTAEHIFNLQSELDAVLIMSQKNRLYYTGFDSTAGVLAFIKNAEKAHLFVDSRYYEMAQQALNEIDIDIHLIGGGEMFDTVYQILAENNVDKVGYEDNELTVSTFKQIKTKLKNLKLIECGDSIIDQRKIKTDDEIESITKAQNITDNAFKAILKYIKVGITELDIAVELEYQMRKLGGSGLAFDSIVASGVNGSKPHAHPTLKKVANGDAVTMDFGAKYNGYCSDMTRTVFVGKPSPEIKTIYEVVLKAQNHAIKNLASGMSGSEGHALASEIINANGYGEYFTHGLGHSLGLDVHEQPRLSPKCKETLKENMLMTVEPGIYVPELGGVRIEDLLLIKQDRIIDLTTSEKNIIIL